MTIKYSFKKILTFFFMYYMYNKKKTKMLFGINLFGTKDVHTIS